jgi:hypothetical protein
MEMPIKQGDMVMIAYPTKCCGSASGYGESWVVDGFLTQATEWCKACGEGIQGVAAVNSIAGQGALLYRLKVMKPDRDQSDMLDSAPVNKELELINKE